MRYSEFKKLATTSTTKPPSAQPTNSLPKSTVGAPNLPKQTTLSSTPLVGAAQAKAPTANPAPTTNALPNTNTATAVQDRVNSWTNNGPANQNNMFNKPNYWSKESITKATQQPKQPQQPQPAQQQNQQGAITRSVYPMGQGSNSTAPAPKPMNEAERMVNGLNYGYKNQPTSEQLSALSPEHRQMVEKAMQEKGMMVAPDAFKDAESTKNFVNGMEGTVRANTSTGQQIKSVGMLDTIGAIFGKDVPEQDKAALFQQFKENNPQWFPSLVTAVKNGSPDALKELQKMMGDGKSGVSYFTDAEKQQLMGAAQSASWSAIKSNPLVNLPKIAGLFLRSKGWNGAADFAENPVGFYGSAMALLFGGSMLLGGGDDEEEQPQQMAAARRYPAGYYRTPYT